VGQEQDSTQNGRNSFDLQPSARSPAPLDLRPALTLYTDPSRLGGDDRCHSCSCCSVPRSALSSAPGCSRKAPAGLRPCSAQWWGCCSASCARCARAWAISNANSSGSAKRPQLRGPPRSSQPQPRCRQPRRRLPQKHLHRRQRPRRSSRRTLWSASSPLLISRRSLPRRRRQPNRAPSPPSD
jgi:hypothetical protein